MTKAQDNKENKDKLRVYEYAKSLNMSSKEIITILKRLNLPVNNHMSVMENDMVAKVEGFFRDIKANAAAKRAQEASLSGHDGKTQQTAGSGEQRPQTNKSQAQDRQGTMNSINTNTKPNQQSSQRQSQQGNRQGGQGNGQQKQQGQRQNGQGQRSGQGGQGQGAGPKGQGGGSRPGGQRGGQGQGGPATGKAANRPDARLRRVRTTAAAVRGARSIPARRQSRACAAKPTSPVTTAQAGTGNRNRIRNGSTTPRSATFAAAAAAKISAAAAANRRNAGRKSTTRRRKLSCAAR
ncbi:translation initiation factor IF-2 [Paenibacillus sp. 32O-W]|nr:translation initiation factor IF-2 [Paenibacillus sp. 32O-W]